MASVAEGPTELADGLCAYFNLGDAVAFGPQAVSKAAQLGLTLLPQYSPVFYRGMARRVFTVFDYNKNSILKKVEPADWDGKDLREGLGDFRDPMTTLSSSTC